VLIPLVCIIMLSNTFEALSVSFTVFPRAGAGQQFANIRGTAKSCGAPAIKCVPITNNYQQIVPLILFERSVFHSRFGEHASLLWTDGSITMLVRLFLVDGGDNEIVRKRPWHYSHLSDVNYIISWCLARINFFVLHSDFHLRKIDVDLIGPHKDIGPQLSYCGIFRSPYQGACCRPKSESEKAQEESSDRDKRTLIGLCKFPEARNINFASCVDYRDETSIVLLKLLLGIICLFACTQVP
jgi:hypothetical protein